MEVYTGVRVEFPSCLLEYTGSNPVTATWEFGKVLLRDSFVAADIDEFSLVIRGEHGPSDKLYGEASAFTGRVSEFNSHIRYFLLLVSWNATGFWLTLKGVDWRVHKRELWCASKRDFG